MKLWHLECNMIDPLAAYKQNTHWGGRLATPPQHLLTHRPWGPGDSRFGLEGRNYFLFLSKIAWSPQS